jgi:proteasome activator subunit 4
MLPDLTSLTINGPFQTTSTTTNVFGIPLPDDIADTHGDPSMEKLKEYAKSVPYAIEPYSRAIKLLDFFLLRLTQTVEAKDFDIGFLQWDSMLT